MDLFGDLLNFLLNCDCSVGGRAGGVPALPAILALAAFAGVLLRRRK